MQYKQLSWHVQLQRMKGHKPPNRVMTWNSPDRGGHGRPKHEGFDANTDQERLYCVEWKKAETAKKEENLFLAQKMHEHAKIVIYIPHYIPLCLVLKLFTYSKLSFYRCLSYLVTQFHIYEFIYFKI